MIELTEEQKKLIEYSKYIEENEECPNCKEIELIDTGTIEKPVFLCRKCGYIYEPFKKD